MYTYYLQTDTTQGLRRYKGSEQNGERWNRNEQQWTKECADRRSCELTHDKIITEAEMKALQ